MFADKIVVKEGITLSTETDAGDLTTGNDIVFRARRIGTPEIENLLPIGYIGKTTSIVVENDAEIRASSIFLISQAEDRALADTLGLMTVGAQLVLDPFLEVVQNFLSLPIKILIKRSEATVTIGERVKILADYMVGIYATAVADASGQAASQLFSIGFAQAEAVALITIGKDAEIDGDSGPVNITSDATATASMSTATEREEQGEVPGRRGSQFAVSLAISWAKLTSKTIVAEGATIHGARTVNVRALGTTESEAEATSSLYADGSASIAVALEFSNADILAQIDGNVQADMDTNGGEVVKFEFDPTVPAANFTSDQVINGLVPRIQCDPEEHIADFNCGLAPPDNDGYVRMGDTVRVVGAVPGAGLAMPAGTIFEYIGPPLTGSINLAVGVQDYRDEDLWRVTSEPWGFVDYANDRIAVYNLDGAGRLKPTDVEWHAESRTFFVSTYNQGALYQGGLDDPLTPAFLRGQPGQTADGIRVAGGRIYVAAGTEAQIRVYDLATRQRTGTFTTGPGGHVIDLEVTGPGDVYVTDAILPMLWHLTPDQVAAGIPVKTPTSTASSRSPTAA